MTMHPILPFLFLFVSSIGVVEAKEANAVKAKNKPVSELLLRKIVGGMPEDRKDTKVYDCKLTATDLPDGSAVKKLIDQLPQETIVGMHVVATAPSVQVLAYKGGKEIVIVRDGSQIIQAKAQKETEKHAVEELRIVVDKHCQTP